MSEEKYQFLDQRGVEKFSEVFLSKVNEILDGRIVDTLDENSTDDQVISAAALNNILNGTTDEEDTDNE